MFSVNSVKIIPAVPPAAPSPPVVPPQYTNISNNNGSNVTLVVINNITTDQQGIDQGNGTEQMEFTVPSKLVISMEPSSDVSPMWKSISVLLLLAHKEKGYSSASIVSW